MPDTFFMLSMALDLDKLMRRGFESKLPMREIDIGYLLHMQMGELFGNLAPRPFRVDKNNGRQIRLLAYCDRPAGMLKEQADTLADPLVHSICDWSSFASKAMPNTFKPGQRFGFELRACPVVRLAKSGTKKIRNGNKVQVKKGAEVDVFIQQAWARPDEKLNREEIYREWLAGQIQRRGGANLKDFRLKAFNRERLIRRDHTEHRKAHRIERPDALFGGQLEITDGEAFASILRTGLGRHRGFGFGMILLRVS